MAPANRFEPPQPVSQSMRLSNTVAAVGIEGEEVDIYEESWPDCRCRMRRGASRSTSKSAQHLHKVHSVAILTEIEKDSSRDLLHRVDMAIKGSPHLAGHRVFCQEESGIVVLHGRVTSFFQKQMAQETLKRLEGVEKVINELEVDWLASLGAR